MSARWAALVALLGAAAAGVLIRLAAATAAILWFDEGTAGLMGRRTLAGEFLVYFHGQAYMGAVDGYLHALPFAAPRLVARRAPSPAVLPVAPPRRALRRAGPPHRERRPLGGGPRAGPDPDPPQVGARRAPLLLPGPDPDAAHPAPRAPRRGPARDARRPHPGAPRGRSRRGARLVDEPHPHDPDRRDGGSDRAPRPRLRPAALALPLAFVAGSAPVWLFGAAHGHLGAVRTPLAEPAALVGHARLLLTNALPLLVGWPPPALAGPAGPWLAGWKPDRARRRDRRLRPRGPRRMARGRRRRAQLDGGRPRRARPVPRARRAALPHPRRRRAARGRRRAARPSRLVAPPGRAGPRGGPPDGARGRAHRQVRVGVLAAALDGPARRERLHARHRGPARGRRPHRRVHPRSGARRPHLRERREGPVSHLYQERYPPLAEHVDAAPRVAYLAVNPPAGFDRSLAATGAAWTTETLPLGWRLYTGLRLEQDGHREIPVEGWTATASHQPALARHAIDRDARTSWNPRTGQAEASGSRSIWARPARSAWSPSCPGRSRRCRRASVWRCPSTAEASRPPPRSPCTTGRSTGQEGIRWGACAGAASRCASPGARTVRADHTARREFTLRLERSGVVRLRAGRLGAGFAGRGRPAGGGSEWGAERTGFSETMPRRRDWRRLAGRPRDSLRQSPRARRHDGAARSPAGSGAGPWTSPSHSRPGWPRPPRSRRS